MDLDKLLEKIKEKGSTDKVKFIIIDNGVEKVQDGDYSAESLQKITELFNRYVKKYFDDILRKAEEFKKCSCVVEK